MEKKWVHREAGDPGTIDRLSSELGIDRVLTSLLVQRGVTTFDEAKRFFRPSLDDLYDPFLMKDMQSAVERIERAIRAGERILIYGDYDVDGTTAVALLYSFFHKRYPKIGYYIPDRYNEGYGISFKGIDYAMEHGYSLIVALDCGIKAIEKVSYANLRKIDFIICDHHLPGEQIPQAVAVLDPKRPDCKYPFKELSGCGVGFKLLQAYCRKNGIAMDELYDHLDLVAVSIASDIVPVIDENRVLAYYGLEKINRNPGRGLRSIIKIAGIEKQQIAIDDIVFRIGPRINAAGRMESGKTAVDLLCAIDDTIASEMGSLVNSCNNDRKNVDRNITHEALRMIASDSKMQHRNTTVLFNPSWHKGVVGIVASRLIETYYRPTVILTQSGALATGSARSVPGYDLYQAVEACADLLENFGGHMYAAGLTMRVERVQEFKERFEEYVSRTITPDLLTPQIDIDASIKLSDITDKFFRILKQFQPFGPGNMAPFSPRAMFTITGRGGGRPRQGAYQALAGGGGESPGISGHCIPIGRAHRSIHEGRPFSVCYTVTENVFRGETTLQVRVKDVKFQMKDFDIPAPTRTMDVSGSA
jgi:single-stranded-DNA-specific exonuclease